MKTLKDHQQRLLLRFTDFRNVPFSAVEPSRQKHLAFMAQKGIPQAAVPEREAINFYLKNHAMSVVAQKLDKCEPLGQFAWFAADYHDQLQQSVLRMFYYLLIICTREARHCNSTAADKVISKYHPTLKAFYPHIADTASETSVAKMLSQPLQMTLGEYSDFLVDIFYKGSYSGGYGGKKWGAVADVFRGFVHGTLTGEMMLDTSYTLCHNNGPIFNKGMLFSMYGQAIKEILDVQRAGMIPAYIRDISNGVQYLSNGHVTQDMREYVQKFSAYSPDFCASVDWKKVKELGALGSYSYKTASPTAAPTKGSKVETFLAAKKAKKEAAELALKEANKFEILPGFTAQKTIRPKAAPVAA